MGRDTFHYPSLLQGLSGLALDTSRDPGAATAALGILCQCLPTLTGKNFSRTHHVTRLSVTLKPFPFLFAFCGRVSVWGYRLFCFLLSCSGFVGNKCH